MPSLKGNGSMATGYNMEEVTNFGEVLFPNLILGICRFNNWLMVLIVAIMMGREFTAPHPSSI
jgi:hypothetical protein